MIQRIKSSRRDAATPKTIISALAVFGIKGPAGMARFLDKELVLYDVKKTYRRAMLLAHPDKGGDPADARQLATAYKIVHKFCTTQPQIIPKSRRRTVVDEL